MFPRTAAIARPYHALLGVDDDRLDRWYPEFGERPTPEETRADLELTERAWREGSRLPLAVAVRSANGWRLVGMADLEAEDTPRRTGTVDCWIDARFGGRGLVTRAVTAVLDQAFGPLGLVLVTWFVRGTDHGGRSAARHLGFVQEGVFQHGALPDERDEAIFRLRADAWHGAAHRPRTAEPGSGGPSAVP